VFPAGKEVLASVRVFQEPEKGTQRNFTLPRGSLVWRLPIPACEKDWTVQVLSVDPFYTDERLPSPPATLAVGCMRPEDLQPVDDLVVMDPKARVFTLGASASCASPQGTLPYTLLEGMRPRRESPHLDTVKVAYERLFGPLPPGEPRVTDWGTVALPFARTLDAEGMAERDRLEKLVSPSERSRGVRQIGPGDPPVYVHALGDDDLDSDIWGTPALVVALMELSAGWHERCVTRIAPLAKIPAHVAKKACTVQINDLGWYNDRLPDPLGHASHATGRCVDIRPFRNDGSWFETNWRKKDDRKGVGQRYSRVLTEAFLRYTMDEHRFTSVIFNDRSIRKKLKNVRKLAGHDDHIHMCVAG
jgi:hypothetical protein